MKFEKLSENKLRIILSIKDLEEKDISFHDFMTNSFETQDLFLDILEEAEEKVGFNTKNYKVKIEALAMTDMDFIVTITRMTPEINKSTSDISTRKKFKVRRKQTKPELEQAIYRFNSFDDYCSFLQCLSQNHLITSINIAQNIILYFYKKQYYLVLNNINIEYPNLKKFYSSIVEFATYINNANLFFAKLQECGNLIIKHNALKSSLIHFTNIKKEEK